jgi:hypothetical protein
LSFLAGVLLACPPLSTAADKPPSIIERFAPPAPRPEEFVTVLNDSLVAGTEPVRFWGASLVFPLQSPPTATTEEDSSARIRVTPQEANEAVVARLRALGIDFVRIDADPGGPDFDAINHFLSLCRTQGIRAWTGGASTHLGTALPDDVDILDDPASAEAWQEAVAPEGVALDACLARVWDPRLELLGIARLRDNARQFNPSTGLRWADDPVVAVWDLAGVERWLARMEAGEWQRLPRFFRRMLLDQWNAWLHEKYETDARLDAAWGMRLARESLDVGTYLLLPLMPGLPESAQREVLETQLTDQDLPRPFAEELSAARRADVQAFLLELWRTHKVREVSQFRRWGDGVRVAPLLWHVATGGDDDLSVGDMLARRTAYADLLEAAPPPVGHKGRPRLLLITPPSELHTGHRADIPWRILGLAPADPLSVVCWDGLSDVLAAEVTRIAQPASAGSTMATPLDASLLAAGLLFHNRLPLPNAAPTAIRGDLTLDAAYLSALCRSSTRFRDVFTFGNGTTFELRETAASVPAEPGSEQSATVETPRFPTDYTVSAALLSLDGKPFAQARTVSLVYGAAQAHPTQPTQPSPSLAVSAAFLAGTSYQCYDGADRKLTHGTVEALPFVLNPTDGTFRVDFVTAVPRE